MVRRKEITLSKAQYEEIDAKFSHIDENYEILRGDKQPVFNKLGVWDSNFVRQRILEDGDRLVAVMDGTVPEREIYIGEDYNTAERNEERPSPDVVIALDKSGRPLKDIADAFWEANAKEGAKKPEFEFLNIDRIDWLAKMGVSQRDAETSEKKIVDIDEIPMEDIARIRALFVEGDLTEENWQEEVWNLPTKLDGKELLILDEVKNSGATLEIAAKLIKRAIPEAEVSGDYFWQDKTHKVIGGETQWATAPIWYKHDSAWGRGVGDINPKYYDDQYEKEQSQENLKRKIGSIVLSAPHYDFEKQEVLPDYDYMSLQQDLAYLTYENNNWFPSPDREDDSWDDRLEELSERTGFSEDVLLAYRSMRIEKMKEAAKKVA